MRFILPMALCLTLIATCTSEAPACQPQENKRESKSAEVDLRPRFQVGSDVRFKMSMSSKTTTGSEAASESTQEMTLRFKPISSDAEKGTTLELIYDSLRISMGDITFDSSKPADANDPMDGILRSIVGLKMNVVMDPNGNITSVSSGQDGGPAGMLAEQFTGADVIKGLFGPISAKSLTTGRVKVGESWKTEDAMAGALGGMKMAMTHTLESVRGGKAKIQTKGKVVFEASQSLPGGVKIKDSKITGVTRWDVESGMLEHMTQENLIDVEAAGDDGSPESKTHVMKVEVARLR